MAFDNSTRRYNPTAGSDSSRLANLLRSPEGDIPFLKESNNSILRNRYDNLNTSARGRNSRGTSSISKKVSYADFTSPKTDSLRGDIDNTLDRKERANTPKKYYFFSEYLKDFNPVGGDVKTPGESGVFESSGYSKSQGAKKDYLLNLETRESNPRPSEVGGTGEYSSRRLRGNHSTTNGDNHAKKEEIKQRLSQLSEKLISPLKSTMRTERRRSEVDDVTDRGYGASGRDFSHLNNTEAVLERYDDDLKAPSKLDIQNLDVKYRIMVQEYENSIRNLKSHLEKVEKSNADIVRNLREELKASRDDLLREKTESIMKSNNDTKTLNERVKELEEQLRQERDKAQQQEDLLEENKAYQDKKLIEMSKEIEKIKSEKERKIEELNTMLKSQNQGQRDVIAKIRSENESMIKKLRDEQNYSVRDLNTQLEKKSAELERIQKERTDALNSLNDKVGSLQEITKNNQETYSRLNRTIELKDDEIEKLTRRLNDTKKDCSILKNELEGIDHDKGKLEQENERLQTKINRLEKMIYGDRKTKLSPYKGGF